MKTPFDKHLHLSDRILRLFPQETRSQSALAKIAARSAGEYAIYGNAKDNTTMSTGIKNHHFGLRTFAPHFGQNLAEDNISELHSLQFTNAMPLLFLSNYHLVQ